MNTLLTLRCVNHRGEGQTERGYSVAEVSDRLGDSALCRRVDGTHWLGKVKMSVHESKSE